MQSKSYGEREIAWKAAVEAFGDSPVVGQGPGGFATFMGWHGRAYAHNLVLEFASELGAAGVLLLGLMLFAVGAPVVRAWRRRLPLNTGSFDLSRCPGTRCSASAANVKWNRLSPSGASISRISGASETCGRSMT